MAYNQNELYLTWQNIWNNFSTINKNWKQIPLKLELGWNAFVIQFYVYVEIWLQTIG